LKRKKERTKGFKRFFVMDKEVRMCFMGSLVATSMVLLGGKPDDLDATDFHFGARLGESYPLKDTLLS
jgi:hypothetical protein